MTIPQQLDERFRAALAAMATAGPPPSRPAGTPDADRAAATGAVDPAGSAGGPAATGLAGGPAATGLAGGLTATWALRLYDAQVASRHLDLAARWLRATGDGYYTIGSSGHEGNAAVAAALRPTDPALLHYRSGAFYCARALQVDPAAPMARAGGGTAGNGSGGAIVADDAAIDPIRDVLRGLVASAGEVIAGGRHKVFGHPDLQIIPTTSTIASHLPRAVGLAFAVERARKVGLASTGQWPRDAVVVASFGDASINHASATAALNTASWCAHTGLPLPLLLVCEDNGLGISVPSPRGWAAAALRSRPGIRYLAADGCDLVDTYRAATEAADWVRRHRKPAVLHLSTVRLMGHAGADAETAYRSGVEIARDLERDPLVATARTLVAAGYATPEWLLDRYDAVGARVRDTAACVRTEPKLGSTAEVTAPLAPRRPVRVSRAIAESGAWAIGPAGAARAAAFNGRPPEDAGPLTLAQSINATLLDASLTFPHLLVFGEDVAAKGGVYGVTKGLRERIGGHRVFDTLLDETSILGLALGAGLRGLLPVPEIQYLAYLHNAEDQLRGEAATMQFFSRRAYRNPMVVRVAGLAYQAGFGGHFHNDNAVGVLRDVPGLVVACPARAGDAAAMLRTCLTAAAVDGTVCVFLEPIALYHTRDLHDDGDGLWLDGYAAPPTWAATHAPIGRARVYPVGSGEDLTIITFGNGVRMSLRVARRLADEGAGTRVVDLRWLAPLPAADLVREAAATGRVLVVDETRRSGGVAEGVLATLIDGGFAGAARRLAAADSFLPLGPATDHVLITEPEIEGAARAMLGR